MQDSRTENYVIITPVRNEAEYISRTLDSILSQTIKPKEWIFVDDGSSDGTQAIVREYANQYSWIKLFSAPEEDSRQIGGRVVRNFNCGATKMLCQDWGYLVKLDADLELPPDYFERLLGRFKADGKLGIASGVYLQRRKGKWVEILMPYYHAAGASKIYRRETFESIDGLIPEAGWDTVDEIKAMYKGWETGHFTDAKFFHLKPEGSALGYIRTNRFLGKVYYLTGGGFVFFIFKVVEKSLLGSPPLLAGIMLVFGYLQALLSIQARHVTSEEARLYRELLNGRLLDGIKGLININ